MIELDQDQDIMLSFQQLGRLGAPDEESYAGFELDLEDAENFFPEWKKVDSNTDPSIMLDPVAIVSVDKSSTLEEIWWVLDEESGMDDLWEQAGDSLLEMVKSLKDLDDKIYPFQTNGQSRLFLARFEIPVYGEDFQFPKAVFAAGAVAFIDFLSGVPVDCTEMLVAIGEYSSQADKLTVLPGNGQPVAPVPNFFEWPDLKTILLNLTAIATKDVAEILADNLNGEPEPRAAHWWFRVNLVAEEGVDVRKFPVPGEFLGLGVRMMPDKPWGEQKSSPFVWSGNWMDTVFYTGAVITEVIDPTDDVPYPTYKVQWRKDGITGKDQITVNPSDFALYKVGDRVTIVKDVATEKTSQLWKDDDMKSFGETWMIAPIGFYGLDKED